ncbi:MAG: hypothetical protein WHS38_11080 [Thermodesulforhabdaceae bacterium]
MKKHLIFGWVSIPILGILAYLCTFKIGFVWDDYIYIQQQLASIREFSFFEGLKKYVYFRPTITVFSLIDYTIWHRNALGYHITNITFHLLNSLLVALLAHRLLLIHYDSKSSSIPWIAGLLFALHPIHTESVNWIEGRTDLICTTFFLLAIISYIEFRSKKSWAALVSFLIFTVFTMAAKEPGVMVPVVVMAYEFVYARERRIIIAVVAVCSLLFGAVVAARSHIIKNLLLPFLSHHSLTELIRLGIVSYGFYLRKIFWPLPLNFFIGELPEGVLFFVFSLISLIGLLVLAVVLRKRYSLISFFILWWLITILPHEVILLGGSAVTPVAERYLYLPSVAFAIVVAVFIMSIPATAVRWVLVLVLVVFYGVVTFHRTMIWTDGEKLWGDTVRKSPDFALPYQWYGNALYEKGKVQEAMDVWKRALDCPYMTGKGMDVTGADSKFRKSLFHTSLALGYINIGDDETARYHLFQSTELFANYHSYFLLGMIERRAAERAESEEFKKEHLSRALVYLDISVQLNPSFQEAVYFLALTEAETGHYLEAMEHFKAALELDPRTPIAIQAALELNKLRSRAYTPVQ